MWLADHLKTSFSMGLALSFLSWGALQFQQVCASPLQPHAWPADTAFCFASRLCMLRQAALPFAPAHAARLPTAQSPGRLMHAQQAELVHPEEAEYHT